MAGEIDGPVVKIGADASKVETTLSGIKGKFDTLASSANSSLSGIGKNFDLSNVSKQIDQVSDKLKGIGTTLSVAALPFEAFGALAVKSFSEFETGIAKIHTLLPDATKSEIDKIGSDLKDFSAQYGADINKATQAYYDALSAGVSQDKALPFLQAAQKAGTAGMSDVSVAVDGITSVLNAYQMGTEKATDVSDTMFQTVNLGKIEFDQLANNIGKVTPTASSFKVGFQDIGAAISQITSLGVSPEETMTGLKNLIKDLGTEGSDLNKKFQEISGQGFTQFMQSGGSLVDVVRMLKDYSDKTGESFFNMTGSFESANTLAMLGGSAFENYAGFLDKIKNSAGATDKAYSAMSDTMAFSMDQLKAQMQTMMIDVGGALAPSVKEFTQWLKDNQENIKEVAVSIAENAIPAIERLFDILKKAMDAFNGMSPETKSFLSKVMGGGIASAAIGGPALYTAGTILGPVSGLISMLSKVAIPADTATDITTIGTGLGNASVNCEKFVRSLSTLEKTKPNLFGISQYIAPIGPGLESAATEAGLFGSAIATLGGPVGLGAVVAVSGAIAAYTTNFGQFRDNVNDIIKDLGSAAEDIATGDFEEAGRNCAKAFGDGLETVTDLGTEIIQKLPNAISGVGNFVSGASEAGEDFGKGIGEGAVKGIESMVGPVSDAIRLITSQNAAQNEIPNAIRGWFSGFTLSEEGKTLGQSLLDGFLSINFGTMADPIKGAFTGAFDEGLSVVKQKMAEFYNTDLADLNSKLETAGIGGQYLASHGNGSQSSNITGSYSGINTVADQRGTQFWGNYASHNGAYGGSSPSSSSLADELIKRGYSKDLANDPASAKNIAKALGIDTTTLQAATNAQTQAISKSVTATTSSTQAQNQQAKTVADAIKGSKSWEEASEKASKAGFSTADALDAWNNRYSNSESVTKGYQDTTSKVSDAQKIQSDTVKTATDVTAGATKATGDQTTALSNSVTAIGTFTDSLANADISGAISKLFSPDSTPGDVAKAKAITEEAGYTGYDANFYQNAIDSAVKAAADQVIKNDINSGYSNGQMAYDLDQRINAVLRKYPGASWQSNAEVQSLTDKYTSNYASDAYIDSVRNGTKAYQQATPSIQNLNQALNSFGLNSDQAVSAQKKVNDIISDGSVSLSEAASYLGNYNQVTGQSIQYSQQQIGQSQEMLSAIMQISAAQSTYSQYMSDGSLSAQEAADMNSRLAEINRLLGDAGITAQSGVSGLPGALQSLASYAQSAAASIQNAISNANAAVASANAYVSSITNSVNSSNKSTVNNTVNMSNMTFTDAYTPQRAAASALQGLIAGG